MTPFSLANRRKLKQRLLKAEERVEYLEKVSHNKGKGCQNGSHSFLEPLVFSLQT